MRRNDREITEQKIIKKFIEKQQILRVGFYDENDIYIVPVNYGYLNIDNNWSFYFHGARSGRKYELAKKEPIVGFEIDGDYKLLQGENACEFTAKFQSIIGTGKLQLIECNDEKGKGLNAIMKQVTHKTEWNYSDEMISAVAVFRLDVVKISCKANI